jgi:hypothetical protein
VNEIEKIALAKLMSGESDEFTVSAYLKIAGGKICRKAYPFDPGVTEVPSQYDLLQVEIAVYLLNKRGADGETSHSENGVSVTYENGDIPNSMLRQIVPVCGVL